MTRIVIVPVIIERGAGGEYSARSGAPLSKVIERQVLAAAERTSGFAEAEREAEPEPAHPAHHPVQPPPPQGWYQAPSDPIARFVDECCETGRGKFVCVADLYRAYQWWCGQNNDRYPLSRQAVGELLEERGVRYSRTRRLQEKQCRTWEGIGLLPTSPLLVTPRKRLEDVKAKLRRALAELEAE